MALTDAERQELDTLVTAFEANGGRGVEEADRIDYLRQKERSRTYDVRVTVDPRDSATKLDAHELTAFLRRLLDCPGGEDWDGEWGDGEGYTVLDVTVVPAQEA